MLMVSKTTSFKKKGKGKKKGNFKKNSNKLLLKRRNPSLDQSLKLSASTAKGLVTRSGTAPSIWRIRRVAKVNKGIFDIHVIDVYLTNSRSSA